MRTGAYISGGAHGALFLWLLVAGFFVARDLPEISVAEISIISTEEFEALQPQSPQTFDAPEAPTSPPVEDTPVAPTPTPTPTPEARPAAPTQLPPPPSEDAADDTAEPVVTAQPDVDILGDSGGVEVGDDDNPIPEAAPKITDEATPAPEDNTAAADTAQDATASEVDAEVVEETDETTAPEQTTTEIVTEADAPSSAPTISARPGRKPTPPAPPEPQVVEEQPTAPAADPIADAVRDALSEPEPTVADNSSNASANSGPPLTRSELSGFRLGIQDCWNVGALGTDALRVSVVVAFTLDRDAKPQLGSIRMVGSEGGTGAAVERAYGAARRAIIKCGAQGYDLPVEKYEQWREVDVTFNASQKQIR